MCLVSAFMILPIPESPRLLLALGKADQLKSAINVLARWNRKVIDWDLVNLEDRVKEQHKLSKDLKINSILPFVHGEFRMTAYTIEISNLPPTTDEPAFKRLLTSRISSDRSENDQSSRFSSRRSLKK